MTSQPSPMSEPSQRGVRGRGAHLVGSVPLESAAAVFRAAGEVLPEYLRRIPDGETGERRSTRTNSRPEGASSCGSHRALATSGGCEIWKHRRNGQKRCLAPQRADGRAGRHVAVRAVIGTGMAATRRCSRPRYRRADRPRRAPVRAVCSRQSRARAASSRDRPRSGCYRRRATPPTDSRSAFRGRAPA